MIKLRYQLLIVDTVENKVRSTCEIVAPDSVSMAELLKRHTLKIEAVPALPKTNTAWIGADEPLDEQSAFLRKVILDHPMPISESEIASLCRSYDEQSGADIAAPT